MSMRCSQCGFESMLCNCELNIRALSDFNAEPDPTAALHARIATLEAQVEAAGMRWPQSVSTLEKALSTFPAGRLFLRDWDRSDAERDAAHWQAFAMAWAAIGDRVYSEFAIARAAAAERSAEVAQWEAAGLRAALNTALEWAKNDVNHAVAYDAAIKGMECALDAARRATTTKEKP